MRRYLLVPALVFIAPASSGQFNAFYSFLRPIGDQGDHIKHAHGLTTGFDFPLGKSRFSIGPELGFNVYGIRTVEMDLPFQNGYITNAKVNYSTSMAHVGAVLRFVAGFEGVNPYAALEGGRIVYYGNMRIDDPDDPLGCKALEQRVLLNDGAWMGSVGGGVKIKLKKSDNFHIDIGGFYTFNGMAEYLKISSHDHSMDPKARMYTVKFEHIPTGEIHEHVVGHTYRTRGQMIDVRLGITYQFGWMKRN